MPAGDSGLVPRALDALHPVAPSSPRVTDALAKEPATGMDNKGTCCVSVSCDPRRCPPTLRAAPGHPHPLPGHRPSAVDAHITCSSHAGRPWGGLALIHPCSASPAGPRTNSPSGPQGSSCRRLAAPRAPLPLGSREDGAPPRSGAAWRPARAALGRGTACYTARSSHAD